MKRAKRQVMMLISGLLLTGSGLTAFVDNNSPYPSIILLKSYDSARRVRGLERYVVSANKLDRNDAGRVGTKAARTGDFLRMHREGKVVDGVEAFAITTDAFDAFLNNNPGLKDFISAILSKVDYSSKDSREVAADAIYDKIMNYSLFPDWLLSAIRAQYDQTLAELKAQGYDTAQIEWAVRSTSPGEDTGEMAAAGMFDTKLYQTNLDQVLKSIKHAFAFTYNEHAIKYFKDHDINPIDLKMAVLVQRMLLNQYSAGIAFGYDPNTGKRNVFRVSSAFGQGEGLVQQLVDPNIHEVTRTQNDSLYISNRKLVDQTQMVVRAPGGGGTVVVPVPAELRGKYVLTDEQLFLVGRAISELNDEFGGANNVPQDIEFGLERVNGQLKLKILQARNATARIDIPDVYKYDYHLAQPGETQVSFIEGRSAGVFRDVVGKILRLEGTPEQRRALEKQIDGNTIVITDHTTPSDVDWMEKALAFLTVRGGDDSHAAITAREKGLLGIIGLGEGLWKLKNGEVVTARGTNGQIYQGALPLVHMQGEVNLRDLVEKLKQIPNAPKLTVIAADAEELRKLWIFVHQGLVKAVGLLRAEHALRDVIKIHPLALIDYDKGVLNGTELAQQIKEFIAPQGFKSGVDFYISTLRDAAILKMASNLNADGSMIYRLSDFKTEEYMALIGGRRYEQEEANFMAGWRGIGRMLDPEYVQATDMELTAFFLAYDTLSKAYSSEFLKMMAPVIRTPNDLALFKQKLAQKMEEMKKAGKISADLPLPKLIMMNELPVNSVLAEEFEPYNDGRSEGSNDDTLSTLKADTREGEQWGKINQIIQQQYGPQHTYSVLNPVVLKGILNAIVTAKVAGKYNGICGQAPSTYPEVFPALLMGLGIENIGLDLPTIAKSLPVVINAMYAQYKNGKPINELLSELGLSVGYHRNPRANPTLKNPAVVREDELSASPDAIKSKLAEVFREYSVDTPVVFKTSGKQNPPGKELNPLFGFYGMAKVLWDAGANTQFKATLKTVLQTAKEERRKIDIELNMVRIPLEAKLAADLINEIARGLGMVRGKDYAIGMAVATPSDVNGIDDGNFINWKGEKVLDFLAWDSEDALSLASAAQLADFTNSKVSRRLPFNGSDTRHLLDVYLEIAKTAAANYHIPLYLVP